MSGHSIHPTEAPSTDQLLELALEVGAVRHDTTDQWAPWTISPATIDDPQLREVVIRELVCARYRRVRRIVETLRQLQRLADECFDIETLLPDHEWEPRPVLPQLENAVNAGGEP